MQTKNAFEVKADLPGVEKKDIKVNVDGDVLTISHERADKKEDKKEENGVKYHVSCLSSTLEKTSNSARRKPTYRACSLAKDPQADRLLFASSSYEQGVLVLCTSEGRFAAVFTRDAACVFTPRWKGVLC